MSANAALPTVQLDHLDLGDDERRLICLACPHAHVVYLAGMDKGLSGSHVWRARWPVGGALSKDHVLKIGPAKKLRREHEAYSNIASAIDLGSPHMALVEFSGSGLAALRQEFATALGGRSVSLRSAVHELRTPAETASLIDGVFRDRMSRWHFAPSGTFDRQEQPLRDALDWWLKRLDLERAADQVGIEGVASSIKRHASVTLEELFRLVEALLDRVEPIAVGPIHGDLHAQNILVGSSGEITLIDFGWTSHRWRAVDFLMLECSLKFLVSPPTARLEDLLLVESLLERAVGSWSFDDWNQLVPRVHGRDLAKIGAAVQAVRSCAVSSGAVVDAEQYRRCN